MCGRIAEASVHAVSSVFFSGDISPFGCTQEMVGQNVAVKAKCWLRSAQPDGCGEKMKSGGCTAILQRFSWACRRKTGQPASPAKKNRSAGRAMASARRALYSHLALKKEWSQNPRKITGCIPHLICNVCALARCQKSPGDPTSTHSPLQFFAHKLQLY